MIYLIQNDREYDYDVRAIALAFYERTKIVEVTKEEFEEQEWEKDDLLLTLVYTKKSTTSSVGTLYLEKKVGNGWTPVTSWSIDGTGSVSITKTYTGTMGITYRTRVVVTTGVDKIDATSTERTV